MSGWHCFAYRLWRLQTNQPEAHQSTKRTVKHVDFWIVTQYNFVRDYQRFGGAFFLHLQDWRVGELKCRTLKVQATRSLKRQYLTTTLLGVTTQKTRVSLLKLLCLVCRDFLAAPPDWPLSPEQDMAAMAVCGLFASILLLLLRMGTVLSASSTVSVNSVRDTAWTKLSHILQPPYVSFGVDYIAQNVSICRMWQQRL